MNSSQVPCSELAMWLAVRSSCYRAIVALEQNLLCTCSAHHELEGAMAIPDMSLLMSSSSTIIVSPSLCSQVRPKHWFVGYHAGPAVQFADPDVALGLVQLGNQVTQTITIRNTSLFSAATWTLHALPQQASSSSASSSNTAAQHAQQAADTASQGMPAVLQAKQQLLQQLQEEAHATDQDAAPHAGATTAAQSGHPFENPPAAEEEEEEHGCSLSIQPECGLLAAGASATVQVSMPSPTV